MSNVALLPEARQLDRYQLIGEIASGGMASVLLARLAGVGGFQRFVAIKRLHPHLAKEREFVEMFLDEARLAASIHHRNVVPILEIGTSDSGYYLVMEYIEGVTLARLMTQAAALREPVPRPVLLRIVVDTLSGLHAAHELLDDSARLLGVVHRDCSPQNILVGLDGCTRITDFGIARASARLHNTREGAMKGKLAYMAPEQTQGDEFDRRADLFSVAVVLWEVLAQRRLFKSKTEAQTLKRLLHDPIPRLNELRPDVSPALASVCAMALERDPSDRFQTAAQMADAIESAAKLGGKEEEVVATERTVEALMKERYGMDVEHQREEVRSWLQATPTQVGPRARKTDPGWMGPTASDEGTDVPTIHRPADEVTHNRAPPEERTMPASRPPPRTKRSWPVPAPNQVGAAARAGEPRGGDDTAASDSEDETHIYDPTSTTGVTAGPEEPEWIDAERDPSAALVARPARRGMGWLAAVAVGLAVVVGGALLWMRQKAASASSATPAASEPTRERPPDTNNEPPAAGSSSAVTPPVDAEPVSSATSPRPFLRLPPASSGSASPAPSSQPDPTPPPPPPPPPPVDPDLDDLTNPYR